MALFIYAFVRNPFTLRVFIAMMLLAFLRIGFESFVGKMTGSMVWENQGIMRLNGPPGSRFGHPNSLSGFAVSTLPFLVFLWPVTKRWSKAALALGLLFAVNIIVFTGSRTGYMAALAFVGLVVLYSRARVKGILGLLLLSAIALPFLPQQYVERFESAFTGQEREGASRASRIGLAADAWELFWPTPSWRRDLRISICADR